MMDNVDNHSGLLWMGPAERRRKGKFQKAEYIHSSSPPFLLRVLSVSGFLDELERFDHSTSLNQRTVVLCRF